MQIKNQTGITEAQNCGTVLRVTAGIRALYYRMELLRNKRDIGNKAGRNLGNTKWENTKAGGFAGATCFDRVYH